LVSPIVLASKGPEVAHPNSLVSEEMAKTMGCNYLCYDMDNYNLLIFQSVANNFPLTD